jgi:hypothetical protein
MTKLKIYFWQKLSIKFEFLEIPNLVAVFLMRQKGRFS